MQMEVKENFISFQLEWDEEGPLMLYVLTFTEKPERNPGDCALVGRLAVTRSS